MASAGVLTSRYPQGNRGRPVTKSEEQEEFSAVVAAGCLAVLAVIVGLAAVAQLAGVPLGVAK